MTPATRWLLFFSNGATAIVNARGYPPLCELARLAPPQRGRVLGYQLLSRGARAITDAGRNAFAVPFSRENAAAMFRGAGQVSAI